MLGGLYLRVFAGIPLQEEAKKEIGIWMDKNTYPSLKFVNPELLHITLFFFGELNQLEVEKLITSINNFKGAVVKASLGGISFFPSYKKLKVCYIRVEQGSDKIAEIYRDFVLDIKELGYIPQGKKFVPHITFARRKKARKNAGNREDWSFFKNKNFNIKNLILDKLVLYRSVLKPDGPEYYPLKEILLR